MPGALLAWVFAIGWVPLYLFRAESVGEALPFYDRTEQRWVRVSVSILALHVTAACVTLSVRSAVPLWRGVLGIGVFGAGISLWLWGRTLIGPLRVRRLPQQPPVRFRCDGAFGIVRHPLYLGYLLAASAPLLVVCRVFLLVTLAFSFTALAVRAVQEERHLRVQIGPIYEVYCRDVKRLIPFVW